MAFSPSQLRRLVRAALVEETGPAPRDFPPLLTAFSALHERLRQRLQSVFGSTAVTALFARGLHLATSDFPWLAEAIGKNGAPWPPERVASLHGVDIDTFEDGLAAVLAQNIELLCTFVGEDLVLPIVREAWGTPLDEDQPGPKVNNE